MVHPQIIGHPGIERVNAYWVPGMTGGEVSKRGVTLPFVDLCARIELEPIPVAIIFSEKLGKSMLSQCLSDLQG
jgi:hypothetical protein